MPEKLLVSLIIATKTITQYQQYEYMYFVGYTDNAEISCLVNITY